jgi:hypothetical protein
MAHPIGFRISNELRLEEKVKSHYKMNVLFQAKVQQDDDALSRPIRKEAPVGSAEPR